MKTVVNNSQVAHLFANYSQPNARNPKNTFRFSRETAYLGDSKTESVVVLFSYSTPIAFFRESNPSVIFVTDEKYSPTTAGQLSDLRRAATHKKAVSVPGGAYGEQSWVAELLQRDNLKKRLVLGFAKRQLKLNNATRPRPAQAAKLAADVARAEQAFLALHGKPLNLVLGDGLAKLAERENAKADRLAKERAERIRLENEAYLANTKIDLAEMLPDWRKGYMSSWKLPRHENAYLRLTPDGETVETSHGAQVPLKPAIAFYERLLKGEALQGQHVGSFTFTTSDADTVTIGCHKIPIAEMSALYESLHVAVS